MKFITNKTGNNFGDKIVTVLDLVTGKNIELFACEGEHSHLDRELKQLRVTRLLANDRLKVVSALGLLHLIKCRPLDTQQLKAELRNDYTPRIIKIAKALSDIDIQVQTNILRFIC